MRFIVLICETPPKISSFEEALYQHRVISPPYEDFELLIVRFGANQLPPMLKSNFPNEIAIIISVKGGNERFHFLCCCWAISFVEAFPKKGIF